MQLFDEVLLEAKRTVDEWGGRLYFVYLPGWNRYAPIKGIANPDRNRVLQGAAAAGLPVIDIHQSCATHKNPVALFPYGREGHYTGEGHQLVAEQVLESIGSGN
jgi:hypothetical protein